MQPRRVRSYHAESAASASFPYRLQGRFQCLLQVGCHLCTLNSQAAVVGFREREQRQRSVPGDLAVENRYPSKRRLAERSFAPGARQRLQDADLKGERLLALGLPEGDPDADSPSDRAGDLGHERLDELRVRVRGRDDDALARMRQIRNKLAAPCASHASATS